MTAPGSKLQGSIHSVGVVFREESPEITDILNRLADWLERRSVSVVLEEATDEDAPGETTLDLEAYPIDLLVALGGDGTLLRAARAVIGTEIPVLGVNLGRLGFLTAFPDAELETGLMQVLDGSALLDRRFVLRASIENGDESEDPNLYALNDIVVHTHGAARVTPLTLEVGDGTSQEEVGSFAADGVIIATPTGSTAYSMSAGGPIIVPDVEGIVVTPICPHSLAVRPLVVPASRQVRVRSLDPDAEHQLTVDGQVERKLAPGETVVVARHDPVSLVRLPGQTFFRTMRRKLNWAARPPERA